MSMDYAALAIQEKEHYEDEQDVESATTYRIQPYELIAIPNDFNTMTIVNFIESNVFDIPSFQRNYVWDKKRASRLIESAIIGLPIPQVFLYERAKNKFLVIDGQQRLMSIYYFAKGRFPKKKKISELRSQYDSGKVTLDNLLYNDEYFGDFKLYLREYTSGDSNPLDGLGYDDLDDEHKISFDMRTIRNVVVRQTDPRGHGSMYEMFNRLNSGGINLTPQEIRKCMYDSNFYKILYNANTKPEWRRFLVSPAPDLHMRDAEVLLRGFAMLIQKPYRPPLAKFLNDFSSVSASFDGDENTRLQKLLDSFLNNNQHLPKNAFYSSADRFSPPIFESVFVAACMDANKSRGTTAKTIDSELLNKLKDDLAFKAAAHTKTTDTKNVKIRLDRAYKILMGNGG